MTFDALWQAEDRKDCFVMTDVREGTNSEEAWERGTMSVPTPNTEERSCMHDGQSLRAMIVGVEHVRYGVEAPREPTLGADEATKGPSEHDLTHQCACAGWSYEHVECSLTEKLQELTTSAQDEDDRWKRSMGYEAWLDECQLRLTAHHQGELDA